MLLGIDHLVIAVRDPDAAAAALERDLGIASTDGGRHATGTFNRLAFLGDTYLELIGVFDRSLVGPSPIGRAAAALLDAGREGLCTYALATDAIEADVRALRADGSPIGDALDGARTRPDGEVVRWRTASRGLLGPDEPPFLIEHEPAGAEWGAEARAARARFRHPVGGTLRLTRLVLPVADPRAAGVAVRGTVGLAVEHGRATVGGQAIELVPRLDAAGRATATVELAAGPGTPPADIERAGVRWVRRASEPVAPVSSTHNT